MVRLIVVRHAKTEWNIGRKIQGRSDIPLSGEGIAAAKEAAALFDGIKVDRVFCSPLKRARQTAELMLGLPYTVDERIVEREFGAYDGRNYLEMTEAEREKLFYGMSDIKGAETSEQVFARTHDFLESLRRNCNSETVAMFSHGVCISYLLYAVTHDRFDPADYEMQYIKNCHLTEVELT